ncbi:MAG TPA: hypothetical protein VGO47_01745 [Chlamydiales bacterium]|jgi:hypothetical protein|nr:hypothetical protein [Chlamydiales bacterium]
MSEFFGRKVTIKCQKKGTFASATDTGVVEQVSKASTWEEFSIYLIKAPDVVALRTWNNKYVSMTEGDYGLSLVDAINDWERFEIAPYTEGGQIIGYTLQSMKWNNRFWKFEENGIGIGGIYVPDHITNPDYFLTDISIVE